jgi:hypothetical protein
MSVFGLSANCTGQSPLEELIVAHLINKLAFLKTVSSQEPVTVAERSKACYVFARLEAGIMGSNPT